jgi:branched-chain amino acid transport system substrate-binding protein
VNRARLALLLLLAVLAACRRPPAAELRVGLVVPLSGSLQDTGISCREGAELAVKELNDAGGLLVEDRRYRVQLLIGDT